MAEDLEKLCKKIVKKAHKINIKSNDEDYIFYFLTPDDPIYKTFSELPVSQVKKLMKMSEISLNYVDIQKNWVTQYSENGIMGDRYTSLPEEQRELIEEELDRKKSKKKDYTRK